MNSSDDQKFMQLCLDEARKGIGFTSPNPMVGAVLVKNEQVIATGFHQRDGGMHAEREALKNCPKGVAKNSTMYVNLEPCCHFGRTPPCTDAIIEAGIKRVVVASVDPDVRVASKGINILRNAGIEVDVGVLADENEKLNSIYFNYKRTNKPYIVLKMAMTLDGKIATASGDAKWISNEESREIGQKLRLRLKGICVGGETVRVDSPRLSCRLVGFENKEMDRIIFSRKINRQDPIIQYFNDLPGRVFIAGENETKNAESFYQFLLEQKIDSLLVEGGSQVAAWFLKNNLVDRIFFLPSCFFRCRCSCVSC